MDNTTDKKTSENPSIGDWVIYKNNQLIAFNKPPGIPVQADKTGDKSLLQLAEIYTKSKLYLVHRIDRPASGVVIFAKTKTAVGILSNQFRERSVDKTYLAVVKNKPEKEEDTIQHHLIKNGKTNRSHAVAENMAGCKIAELKYKLLGSSDNYHLLKIEPLTGRHHQIRAQLAAIENPIKGDVKYGFRRSNKDRSIHLHAWKLVFKHPVSNEKVELTAELPADPVWDFFKDKLP
ncbi:MAG TPA: RNA pseudouridine synthase [Bacteroidetes bacterium]|nr:RNA pseudouridine synthase [Bacteroidota bacterium]